MLCRNVFHCRGGVIMYKLQQRDRELGGGVVHVQLVRARDVQQRERAWGIP
jgi:hypothetical protein